MDSHIYTRELLDKHLLPELKEIAQGLGITPDGNKTRRETWIAALVGQPFPVFQALKTLDTDRAQEPIEPATRNRARNLIPWDFNLPEEDYDPDIHGDIIDRSESGAHCPGCGCLGSDNYPDGFILNGYRIVEKCIDCGNHFYESFYYEQLADVITPVEPTEPAAENYAGVDRAQESIENSPGVDRAQESIENSPGVDRAQELIENSPGVDRAQESIENSPGVDRAQESIENPPGVDRIEEPTENYAGVDRIEEPAEFPDLESALAEIARLRAQNDELLELARSQSEEIRRAKDISPVEKPSLKRVLHLAQAACLDVLKSAEGNWILSMGHLKRSFSRLRDIWDLLISDDWYLMDLFSPPPPPLVAKPLFAPIHSKYSAIPFCDDNLIDTWSLGVNVASSGRSPPAGGDAM